MKTDSLFSLKDKVAIVTGGAGHLGFTISEALAEYGSVVFIASRKVSGRNTSILKLRKRFENRIQAITMDITSSKSIQEAYKYVLDEHKRIDNQHGFHVWNGFPESGDIWKQWILQSTKLRLTSSWLSPTH